MNDSVNKWIEEHLDQYIEDLKDFVSINSVQGSYEQGKPFGDGPFDALNFAIDLADKYGFSVNNYQGYVGTADLDPALPRSLDMLAHCDVVPAGEGWTVTEPFKPVVKDGRIYGRGTSDDKGPLLCALYAMRAIKECGVPLKKGVRLIMGSDEETGSVDISKYYAVEPEAEMTFSPDAEFPLINIEKGRFHGDISKEFEASKALPKLVSMEAGVAVNAVPQKAVLKFEGLDMNLAEEPMNEVAKECGVECIQTGVDEITVTGVSAHASTPETGKNAGIAALLLVTKLPLPECEQITAIKNVLKLFPYGVTDGSGLGIKMCDEESHDLTCTLDMFHITDTELNVQFDSRTPVMATRENCEDVAGKTVTDLGLDWTSHGMVPPHVVPSDSDFVKKLLNAYETVTGLKGEAMAIGGGTYVHELKNGVAFGAVLPGVDTRMHGADEFFDLDNIVIATKVYAEAIIELCS
ncbi:Sapep family Mn(2+)-dependent dipeptidase [Oribacterium sp. WCC10]|uniref:Sapep family Mn(2+)-dependent dipeptidase n=1 Tax=Oribacterium sp. WCC10 TaxID=1855343 RepID=UPI0008F3F1FB|nr:Sapep family Mn(2+)-dependent dipeptidase [Oribacterium sp. WCC10]SFG26340.1 succinyl-diaminopimelate desuccinylase [Oribacterium sp. WCC10]